MKVTIDTNIFVSGLFFPKSNPGRILQLWHEGLIDLILSEELIEEISDVLYYLKIKKKLKWSEKEIEDYCLLLRLNCKIVDIKHIKISVPKDKKDNHILATFITSNSSFLVSGDDDLLSLKNNYKIVSAKTFLDLFKD